MSEMTEVEQAIVRETKEEVEKLERIPADEYRSFAELTARATGIWADAREKKDFSLFAPVLKEIVDYQKRFASYQAKEGQKLYDVMLDNYEKDFGMKELDEFFRVVKEGIRAAFKGVCKALGADRRQLFKRRIYRGAAGKGGSFPGGICGL